ncbi:hypothetical protein LJK88_27145 [Paenibacillus sp. P26]|nr:hypothetical protein LJK88_27145 [Paenibacillus sp. P26]UUZ94954.1 hypothetical protein LJK87_10845 [Paenibacillus sp. P25]
MPYVLRHESTGEILACIQKNIYRLDYYGIKWWETEEEAEAARPEVLEQLKVPDPHRWQILRVDEHRLKLFNVKLKNNPNLLLRMDNQGTLLVSPHDGMPLTPKNGE